MRKSLTGLFILALFACASCRAEIEAPAFGSVTVYYCARDVQAPFLQKVERALPSETAIPLEVMLDSLFAQPEEEGLYSPIPEYVEMISHRFEDEGTLVITLSDNFRQLDGLELTSASACVALTLCSLPKVSAVRLVCKIDDREGLNVEPVKAADYLTSDLVLLTEERTLTLYFVGESTQTLSQETRSIVIRENESAYRYCMEELLEGPKKPGLLRIVDADEKPLSVKVEEDGICYLNMSSSFYEGLNAECYDVTLQAIVFSLTEVGDAKSVRFLQEGSPVQFANGWDSLLSREDF